MDKNNHLPFSLNESVFLKVKYCLIHSQNIICHFVKLLINILPIRWLFWIRKNFACSIIVAESYNILEQKYIFQIGTLNLTVSTSPFHSTNLFLFSHHHISTNSVAPLLHRNPHNPQLLQSLWRRANARNVSFFILYGGQFTFSTQLLTLNYLLYSPTYAAPQFL